MDACPKCGQPLDQDQRFCTGCGEPVAPSPSTATTDVRRSRVPLIAALVVVAVLAGVAGGAVAWNLRRSEFEGGPQPPIGRAPVLNRQDAVSAAFEAAMAEAGWDSLADGPTFFMAKSQYELADGGFVQLIEYRDAETARRAQEDRADQQSANPGFSRRDIGEVGSFSTLVADDDPSGDMAGMGSVEIRFAQYRFEGYGLRSEIDELVDALGYLAGTPPAKPFDAFREAVSDAGIATSADRGYTYRQTYRGDGMLATCDVYATTADARASFDATVELMADRPDDFESWEQGRVSRIWFETWWPDAEGTEIEQYATRAYDGRVMVTIAGPVEAREAVDAMMERLGY